MPQVAVIGGGPAGSTVAKMLAADGRDVVVVEDHPTAGQPAHCAGVVTAETIRLAGVRPDVIGTVCAADVVFPDGRRFSLDSQTPIAYVIDRPALDARLADEAAQFGAQYLYGEKYLGSTVTAKGVSVATARGSLQADLLIGADGQCSHVAASLRDNAAREYLRGVQVDLAHVPEDLHRMVLRIGHNTAPGFFSWELPLGDHTRVGLCVAPQYGTPSLYLKKLLIELGLDRCPITARYSGKIPLGGRRITHGERTLLIGDAAGQVKPVSGGGLYPIFTAAPLLRETVARAYDMNDFSSTVLALYDRAWKKALGNDFSWGWKMRKMFCRMSDDDYNQAAALLDTPEIREILAAIDLDRPAGVIRPILAQKGIKSGLFKLIARTYL